MQNKLLKSEEPISRILNERHDDADAIRGVVETLQKDLANLLDPANIISVSREPKGLAHVEFRLPESEEGASCTLEFGEIPGSWNYDKEKRVGKSLVAIRLQIADPMTADFSRRNNSVPS